MQSILMYISAAGRQITNIRGSRVKIIALHIWGRNSNYICINSFHVTFYLKTKLEMTTQIELKVFCALFWLSIDAGKS